MVSGRAVWGSPFKLKYNDFHQRKQKRVKGFPTL